MATAFSGEACPRLDPRSDVRLAAAIAFKRKTPWRLSEASALQIG